jgi:predicted NBD/HSP70 family sugar kinase
MAGRSSSATTTLLRDLNERTVLETIRAERPISRAEISRRVGISKPTVSLALQSLLEAGLVRETEHDPGGPSYGARFFEPVAAAALVLGIDIGARFLRMAVCDLEGVVHAREDVEHGGADVRGVLDLCDGLTTRLIDATGMPPERLDGIVVGVPGVVAPTSGEVQLAENVPGLDGLVVANELATRLGRPVVVENDINLAALGEQWRGVGAGIDDFAFLSVGTGLGSGLVLRGELHRGHHGAAGEVDYASGSGVGSPIDPCASAVSALAEQLASTAASTTLRAPYDVRSIFDAARAGDLVARQVVDEEARRIALHISPIAAVADVALVVLGGGVGINGDLLLPPVRAELERQLPYPPRLEVSSLGDAAVLTGALAVGLRAALDNVFERRISSR